MTVPQYSVSLPSATMLAGRVLMDLHADAPHVVTAQVQIPRFVASPVVVATVSERSGSADVVAGSVGNPGKMVVCWEIDYNPDSPDQTYLTFDAANVTEGEALDLHYAFTVSYIVVGDLATSSDG